MQLERFKTPPDAVSRADQMECILFADYDPYPDERLIPKDQVTQYLDDKRLARE